MENFGDSGASEPTDFREPGGARSKGKEGVARKRREGGLLFSLPCETFFSES
jgi:hypothetical protein